MPKQKPTILYYTPAIGWGILIAYFSLVPSQELPGFLISAKDVLLHFSVYLGLSLLIMLGANRFTKQPVSRGVLFFILIWVFLMGTTIEFLQENFAEGRHFEWGDILFNMLGAAAVFFINPFLKR